MFQHNNDLKNLQEKIMNESKDSGAAVLSIDYDSLEISKEGKLAGIPYAMKNNYAIKGVNINNSSKVMKSFVPTYDSTVYKKLAEAGAIPLVVANMDELAMGGSGRSSNIMQVHHPKHKDRIIGGSSSGSAYLVANGDIPFAIGSDTGDSVRKPAVYGGIVGFKPTWGLVSRYGVYDFAPSWDTVGWLTNTVEEASILMDVLQGYDEKDASSIKPKQENFQQDINTDKKFKIGIVPSIIDEVEEPKMKENFFKFIEKAKQDGHEIIELDIDRDILSSILVVYRTISSVEALSTNSSLTGYLFGDGFGKEGTYDERVTKARTDGLGYEVKRRLMFGAEAVMNNGSLYNESRKARAKMIEELAKGFALCDVIANPGSSNYPPTIESNNPLRYGSLIDDYLALFNANGSPSITIPTNKDKTWPTAMNIAAKPFNDKEALQVAKIMEGYNE